MQKNESGSAHVVIIIILVVALLGAVGYIAWKNLSPQDTQETSRENSTSQTDSSDDTSWKTYSSQSGYTVQYPADWLLVAETDTDGPYIRNEAPKATDLGGHTGYQEGYQYLRINTQTDADLEYQGITATQWYASLGTSTVMFGPADIQPADVKNTTVNGMPAKQFITAFTETNTTIAVLKNDIVYLIAVYPEDGRENETLEKIINSFTLQ